MPSADAPFAERRRLGRLAELEVKYYGTLARAPFLQAALQALAIGQRGRLRLHKVLIVEPGTALDCHLAHYAALRPLGSP